MRPKISDAELIQAWKSGASAPDIAAQFSLTLRQVYARRAQIERNTGEAMPVIATRKFGVPFDRTPLDNPATKALYTWYGINSGTLADPDGPQFGYSEDSPANHRSGFVVLTYHKGLLLRPAVCKVLDEGSVDFERQVIKV